MRSICVSWGVRGQVGNIGSNSFSHYRFVWWDYQPLGINIRPGVFITNNRCRGTGDGGGGWWFWWVLQYATISGLIVFFHTLKIWSNLIWVYTRSYHIIRWWVVIFNGLRDITALKFYNLNNWLKVCFVVVPSQVFYSYFVCHHLTACRKCSQRFGVDFFS